MFKKFKSLFDKSGDKNKAPAAVEVDEAEPSHESAQPEAAEVAETVPAEAAEADVTAEAAPGADLSEEIIADEPIEPAAEVAQAAVVEPEVTDIIEPEPEPEPEPAPAVLTPAPEATPEKKQGMFARIKAGLSRTKANLSTQLGNLFLGAKEIDDELLEDIETLLLTADVGVEATAEIISRLTDKVARNQLADAQALQQALQQELAALLQQAEQPLQIDAAGKQPYVILMVGVNGVGKTTTIGKLAKRFQAEGRSVMLAAGDTFRAAAVEQLQVWGERNQVPVVAQHTGADSASVLFDALQSAKARNVDVLIADTAGRLQNKDHLMQELQKVVRVMQKLDMEAPHEVMLVLDAGTGQNAMSQARTFKDAVGVTGITLTKLDGTAKGGIIFAIAKQLELPIRYIGVGEQVDDLRPFSADEFVKALFD
ncbi:signal recognition particle-docking protein FtsY [Marinobacterium rhizophilum]|uniref:Signal recognition particle receptor FtsY n=1 Tax=Marinobacterium rhizophilum TaxID=420402 RepID=A0ABY5HED7_9GAMM|nr:signal recognition particle-docking protein FtsY [Marinobacterium rhizophilum]UTW10723.1 signal recognition particle-docking protein FtsY [Marinobacterium rhizophilum]